ncbi:MAG: anti-sigma factor [Actinobacteria bacterium]|nr:anti-sigma factor [Actinomycetota bacterium]
MRTELRHSDVEELLGVYALDAVDDVERLTVDQHLTACARCRAEVEEYREVAALLAHTGAPAPEGLWARIAESIEGEAAQPVVPPTMAFPRLAPSPSASPSLGSFAGWRARAGAVLLAAAAAVIVVLGVQVEQQDDRLDEMSSLLSLDALERAYQAAETAPGSKLVQVASFDGQIDAQAVITSEGVGYLRASSLPRLPEGRIYQLWGDAVDQRVSLGSLGPAPEVAPFGVSGRFVGIAITEETEPGVIVSEQPVLAYGVLPQ